eukprot:jgi/Tetstr1/448660/TSEL_035903.t1
MSMASAWFRAREVDAAIAVANAEKAAAIEETIDAIMAVAPNECPVDTVARLEHLQDRVAKRTSAKRGPDDKAFVDTVKAPRDSATARGSASISGQIQSFGLAVHGTTYLLTRAS